MTDTKTRRCLDSSVPLLDPDPITVGSFVFAAIGAAAGLGSLLHQIITARKKASK